jgi:proteasome lid subunit RPN8/RPN11
MKVDRIRLDGEPWAAMTAHLQSCLPEEGCGLLAGRLDRVELVLPIENVEHSEVHYHMEHRALVAAFARIEALELELLGVFHSHPNGPVGVSQSDVREWQYPEVALVVCVRNAEGWEARAFLANEHGVSQVPFLIDRT